MEWVAFPFLPDPLEELQGIFPTQGSNPGLPHCRQILYRGKMSRFAQDCPSMTVHSHPSPLARREGLGALRGSGREEGTLRTGLMFSERQGQNELRKSGSLCPYVRYAASHTEVSL